MWRSNEDINTRWSIIFFLKSRQSNSKHLPRTMRKCICSNYKIEVVHPISFSLDRKDMGPCFHFEKSFNKNCIIEQRCVVVKIEIEKIQIRIVSVIGTQRFRCISTICSKFSYACKKEYKKLESERKEFDLGFIKLSYI